jgi:hypothetical protein
MFLCEECFKKETGSGFGYQIFQLSYGCCEACGIKTGCFDYHGYKYKDDSG